MRAATTLLSQPNVEGERKSINSELWHACAGPKVSLPPVGSLVVYFPQGHSEQVAASTQKEVDGQIPNYPSLPSQLICQLHNVTLHADIETDEVFSQMTLQPVSGQEKDAFFPPDVETQNRQPTDFFCKTLTASDTSTHGGFSVPRRAAEKVFPPLDFSKQPPAQELQARDLHDQIWTFRHIYRGQPKRHLLTTGWSVFVSAKRLVAGDSVLFIRDDKGQLLLGIRRANRQQMVMPSSVLSSDSMHIGVLAAAAHAAATSSRFIIFYNPRASPSEFVIPLSKYNKAVYGTRVSVGMRFRMVFETDESTLRRHMGTITGISDLDAVRWPNSQWRNLEVGWDESSAGDRPRRVSVWEIEPASTPFLIYPPPFSLRPKRMRHPVLPGEDDVDGNLKRCLTWLRGDNSNDGSYLQGLGSDPWMRFKQRMETSATLPQPDLYHASGAAALQEFRGIDASKQRLQTQHSQMMQFRLLQQQSHQSDNPQQQLLPSQRYPHQQPFQKQQHPSAQPQQLPHLPVPQQQLRSQIQAPSVSQQQLQAPSFSQQLHPQQLQQHASLPFQQQAVPMPDLSTQLLNRPQPTLNVPTSTRMQPSISEVDTSNSPILNQFLLQSMFEKCQLPVQDNYQISTSFRPNSSQPERGSFLTTPAAPREMQVTSASFPSNRNTVQTEICSTVANMQQLERPDGPSSITNSFLLSSEPPVQTGLASLPLQSCSNVFQASSQHQEAEPDPWAHQLFEMNGECFSSRGFDIGKDAHAQAIHGTTPVGSFPSSSESLCSLPGSFALPSLADNSMNELMVSSALDEAIMSCGYGWPQIPAPVRTFTKVQKFGSVGRSLDVSRFQNYDELRRELARMFNLEGQLEDPRRSNWQLVFVDNDGDVLLVGDDPWEEFVGCVRIIRILSPSEVQQMSHDGFDSISIPMQQQTSSSSEVCHPWKDSRDPKGGSLDRRVS